MMKLCEYDQIRTEDGTLWVVHGAFGERFVCRPKYVPDSLHGGIRIGAAVYARLSSPLFAGLPQQYDGLFRRYEEYRPVRSVPTNLYLIGASDIADVMSAMAVPTTGRGPVARAAHDLRERITQCCAIPPQVLGVTGSVALGSDLAGLSDIDIVIYGRQFYERLCRSIRSLECFGLRLRDQCGWEQFFVGREVRSYHSHAVIVQRALARFDQGLYRGVPYTIFVARPELRQFRESQERCDDRSFHGTVSDAEEAYYYPVVLKLANSAGLCTVESYDRVDRWGFPCGGEAVADGLGDSEAIVVIPGRGSLTMLHPA